MEAKKNMAMKDKILVVDDDRSVRDFLVKFLNKKGYSNVRAVETGLQALKTVEKENIKLVLLDIKLPGMDGIEVLRKIKSIKRETHVIMITGFPEESVAQEAMREGAYDYIMKPFDLAYLELSVFSKIIQAR